MATISKICQQRIFALLRASLFGKSLKMALFEGITDDDWQQIYSLTLAHGVLAIIYDSLKLLPEEYQPDIELKIQWAYNVQHIEKFYKRQHAVAQKLTERLSQEGIKPLILKGLSTAALYPIVNHRQFGDIDIYLGSDFEEGNRVVSSMGVKITYDYFVHSEFTIGGINIENHRHFVNPDVNATGAYIESALEQIADSAVPHPTIIGALAPSAEMAILFAIRHSSWHFARESITLRDICDWALMLDRYKDCVDFEKIAHQLTECGLERYTSIITTIAAMYLEIDTPLILSNKHNKLVERTVDDIFNYQSIDRSKKVGTLKTFCHKIGNRFARKWCYDLVVPDSFYGNIWYSIKGYLQNPIAIFKAKL